MNNRIFGKIFNVYKPVGLSSYDVVRKFKKVLNYRKIGHGGTLDPFAERVLLILVGRKATRQINELLKLPKSYRAVVQLGKTTATGDPEGEVIKEKSVGSISNEMLDTAIDEFSKGTYIRKLGQDIAEFLGTAGYLTKLMRTSIGDYNVDDSIYIDDLEDKLVKTKDKLRKLAFIS